MPVLKGMHMKRPTKMNQEQILLELKELKGWKETEGMLYREFELKDFSSAWAFMTRVAMMAEKMDHHPDWNNVYNKVSIKLSTHDAKGITALDFELARAINDII